MDLSDETRLVLRNQYQILEHIDPENKDWYHRAVEVLESGYEFEYETLAPWIRDPMSHDECLEVIEILEMHRDLHISYEALQDTTVVEERDIRFHGFDGNNEPRQLGYAHFLIEDEGKWAELAGSGDGLNSHLPVLDTYRRMQAVWKDCVARRRSSEDYSSDALLTADDIKRIAEARVHPDNRPDSV